MPQRTSAAALVGGMDLITPALQTVAGRAIAGVNYEPHPRGYRRIDGFERFSGLPKPSEAEYWVLNFDAGDTEVAADDEVTGATSGATGTALITGIVETGSYGGSDAAGYIVLTGVTGTFADDEDLQVSAATVAVANGVALRSGALTDATNSTWQEAAIERARNLIAVVPGSGVMRGVWVYKGVTYAFRDNAGGTACVMHKSTTSGWVAQSLGLQISFTGGGTYEVAEGNTITGATSAATATVERIVLDSGTWAGGDAAGRLILSGQTGTFASENLDVGGNLNVATIAGDSDAITLLPGGVYEFVTYNFFGASNLQRMYGADGINAAFEWDGSVYVPILTGMVTDTPTHVVAHKKHLFLSYLGGSVQNSAIGEPYSFSVVLGAAEIGIGEDVTAFLSAVSGVLTIFGRNSVNVLYGNDSSDWDLKPLTEDAGAIPKTAKMLGSPHYLDDRGIRSLDTTQAFGDFRLGTITNDVEPIFAAKKLTNVTAVDSVRVRTKDQYRLFWSDGTGLTIYLGRKKPEIMPFDIGKVVHCVCSAENSAGDEIMFFGSDDGFIYELDKGTSFDGSKVEAYIRLPFNSVGSPTLNKRFHKVTLEVDAAATTTLGLTAEFSYADPDQPPSRQQLFSVRGEGGFWNEFLWNQFFWSAPVHGRAEAYVDGEGLNIGVAAISDSTYEKPHILHGMIVNYSPRGINR